MSILFSRVQKINPQDRNAPKKWYPVLKRVSQVSEDEVAKQISDETTLNKNEAKMSMSQLEKVVLTNLLASRSVKLGNWASIHAKCRTTSSETKEGVTAKNITKVYVSVTISQEFLDRLNSAARFVPVESLVSDSE